MPANVKTVLSEGLICANSRFPKMFSRFEFTAVFTRISGVKCYAVENIGRDGLKITCESWSIFQRSFQGGNCLRTDCMQGGLAGRKPWKEKISGEILYVHRLPRKIKRSCRQKLIRKLAVLKMDKKHSNLEAVLIFLRYYRCINVFTFQDTIFSSVVFENKSNE